MPATNPDLSAALGITLPIDEIATWLPPVSELAKVDCRSSSASMSVGEALAMALSLVPKAPDLDLVALAAPARLDSAIAHHMAVAVLAATIQHHRTSG
jgi:hypothetical protein